MQTMPPNETSPLLPKPLQTVSPHPIAEDSSIAPDDPYEHGPDDVDGDQLERQPSNGDASLHQGMPEVRKRMKYIFPAICIGVRTSSLSCNHTRLTHPGLPFRRRPDPRGVYLRHHRDRAQSPKLHLVDSHRLLRYLICLPASLRQDFRHLRSQAMSPLRLPRFRHRLDSLRLRSHHRGTDSCKSSGWPWRRWHEYYHVYSDE